MTRELKEPGKDAVVFNQVDPYLWFKMKLNLNAAMMIIRGDFE